MEKLYHSISEVSELTGEEQHILRYWEKEFKSLKPKKNSAGNRKYTNKDISMIREIKSLIRERNLSLNEAKQCIDFNKKISNTKSSLVPGKSPKDRGTLSKEREAISQIINDLRAIVIQLRN